MHALDFAHTAAHVLLLTLKSTLAKSGAKDLKKRHRIVGNGFRAKLVRFVVKQRESLALEDLASHGILLLRTCRQRLPKEDLLEVLLQIDQFLRTAVLEIRKGDRVLCRIDIGRIRAKLGLKKARTAERLRRRPLEHDRSSQWLLAT